MQHWNAGRKLVRSALSVLLMAVVVGCGGAATPGGGASSGAAAQTGGNASPAPSPANPDVILATTTSTQDSGLLDELIPTFEGKTGYKIKTIAVGTGQALAMGEKGEADVLLVHAPADEKRLVESGAAVDRRLVMHNDFILVGPPEDPAGTKEAAGTTDALKRVRENQAVFLSRGDESGTHKKELALWKSAGIEPSGAWYQETGSGMGQTLNVAAEKRGYTLTDRATFLALKKNLGMAILVEGDPSLLNIYHVMLVNPAKYGKVNAAGAKAFADFLLSAEGQEAISQYGVEEYGEPLFFADGGKTEEELTQQ